MDLTITIPVLIGIVEMFKMAGLPSRFAPFISVGCGVLIIGFVGGDAPLVSRILEGVIAGLSASGLYSGVKSQR